MSGGRDWTTTEARRLHELRAQRIQIKDIAVELGRTPDAIYAFLKYVPVTRDNPPTTKPIDRLPPGEVKGRVDLWTPEEIEQVRELAQNGSSAQDAAEVTGRSVGAVRGIAYRHEIRFRHRGGWSPICRIDQEGKHFRLNAIEGSALLRDTIFAVFVPEVLAA